MKTALRSTVFLYLTICLIAWTSDGIQPRRNGGDYPQHGAKNGIILNAYRLDFTAKVEPIVLPLQPDKKGQ